MSAPREYAELFCVGELTEMEKGNMAAIPYRERWAACTTAPRRERAGDTLSIDGVSILAGSDQAKAEAARKAMSRERRC